VTAPLAGTRSRGRPRRRPEQPQAGARTARRDQLDSILLSTAKALRRAYETALDAKLAITLHEANLLSLLAERGSLTQVDLAKRLGVSRARIGVHIDSLEVRGAVKRMADPSDRRVWRVSLTSRGRSLWKQSVEVSRAVGASVHQGLTADDLATLDRLLLAIRGNLALDSDGIARRGSAPVRRR
jgi:DNA-binding MarR family transcriptional regulator